jgi:RNA polymerase sigma factor (sigma-70 family)
MFNRLTTGRDTVQSDESLLQACRDGDESAWEALVERYQRLVFSVPRRAGLSPEAAADVFQAVFATLVEHIDRIEQPERLSAWLVTTARRESWRVNRKEQSSQAASSDDDELERQTDRYLLPDEVLVRLELQHEVRAALDRLDKRCRDLLLLLYYRPEPAPYTEIAATLQTPEGSIGPTRARCLQKMRRLLPS